MQREWLSINKAPRDEKTPILVYFDHDADTYQDPAHDGRLTDYAANAEGGDFLEGKGVAVAVWRDGYHDSDGWEAANSYWVPGGWFAWLNGDATDCAVNALLWTAIPTPSAQAIEAATADKTRSGLAEGESAVRQDAPITANYLKPKESTHG